jgi:hypothetical protein
MFFIDLVVFLFVYSKMCVFRLISLEELLGWALHTRKDPGGFLRAIMFVDGRRLVKYGHSTRFHS